MVFTEVLGVFVFLLLGSLQHVNGWIYFLAISTVCDGMRIVFVAESHQHDGDFFLCELVSDCDLDVRGKLLLKGRPM